MRQQQQEQNQVPIYPPFASQGAKTVLKYVDVFDLYEMIRNDTFKPETTYIHERHGAGATEGFKTISKEQYKVDKNQRLFNTTFSTSNRFCKDASVLDRINLDNDCGTPEELDNCMKVIKTGKVQFIEAAWYSVGGKFNKSFTCNVKRCMPVQFFDRKGKLIGDNIPQELKKVLNIKSKDNWRNTIDKIHKCYYAFLAYFFKKDLNTKLGTAKDLNRVRFLNHDPDIYVNADAKELQLSDLLNAEFLSSLQESKEVVSVDSSSLNINETDALKYAAKYAESKGHKYIQGLGRYDYILSFSICCNLLGVEFDELKKYAAVNLQSALKEHYRALSYPYKKYKEKFGSWAYKIAVNKYKEIKGNEGDKLSVLLKDIDVKGSFIVSPTGSGKTYFISKWKGLKIIACPTIQLCNNVAFEYGAACFHSEKKDVLKGSKFIVTTYNSLPKILKILDVSKYDLIIDEAHNFTSSASKHFRLSALNEVLNIAEQFKSITMLTGTKLYNKHPLIKSMPIVKVSIPRPKKGLIILEAKDTSKAAADAFNYSIYKGNFPIILFNNTKEEGDLGELKSLIGNPNILIFNSYQKADKYFKEVVQTGNIPEHIQGMIVTTVLKEGNNILNNYNFDIIILGRFHSSDIEQVSNRPRQSKQTNIYLIKRENRLQTERNFNSDRFAWGLEKRCLKRINEAETSDTTTDEEQLLNEMDVKQMIQSLPIKYDENKKLVIDDLLFSNHVFETQKTVENQNDKVMIENLEKYGIELLKHERTDKERTEKEKLNVKVNKAIQKEIKLKEFEKEFTDLQEQKNPLQYCQDALNYHSKNLTKTQKIVLKNFVELSEYVKNDKSIFNILDDVKLSNAKFKLTLAQIKIQALKNNQDYMQSNRAFTIAMKKIYNTFYDGQTLTGEQISEQLIPCLELDKSFDFSFYNEGARKTKAINLLRHFFKVTKQSVRCKDEQGKVISKFVICNLNFDRYYIKTNETKVTNKDLPQIDIIEQIANDKNYKAGSILPF